MAATEKGVWDLQEVRDKQLAGEWSYTGATNLYVWGQNYSGQLANNTTFAGRSSPIQVGTDTTWWQVRSAVSGVYAIKTDGTLWAWGYNGGALGLNDQVQRSSPTQVGTATHWKTTKYGFGQSNKSFFGLVSS